jgi:hypothetical protein
MSYSNNTDLFQVAKGWIQRDDQFPIGFDEIWERAGYKHRKHAARAFEKCVVNFGLVTDKDHAPLKGVNVITRYGKQVNGRPRQS